MTQAQIRFDDGAAYERFMGVWSRSAGDQFLDWLQPGQGQRWLDVGCGNGAFSERLMQRLAPSALEGVDPSEAQIDYARRRASTLSARFQTGDAMALPFPDAQFDQAVMALVIFFVPDPAVGVAEMARVTRPGGCVSAYAWDLLGGGFPYAVMQAALQAIGKPAPMPPQAAVATRDGLEGLWRGAGLRDVRSTTLTVTRSFKDFDDFWDTACLGPIIAPVLADLSTSSVETLREQVRQALPVSANGEILMTGLAHAVAGIV